MTKIDNKGKIVKYGKHDISSMIVDKEFRQRVVNNINSNDIIAEYFLKLSKTFSRSKYLNILEQRDRLMECNKVWELLKYRNQNVKVWEKTYLCKNKFCFNCKKWRQGKMLKKYTPLLCKLEKNLYFVTFTVPNSNDDNLRDTLKHLIEAYSKLNKVLSSKRKNDKLKIFNADIYGYKGSVRSIEISINRDRKNKYHAHIHALMYFGGIDDEGFILSKPYIINRYSIDHSGRRDVRKFTNQEVEFQKLWYLIYENIDLKSLKTINTYKAFDENSRKLKNFDNKGYSVTIDKVLPGEYGEVFKYIVKDYAVYFDDDGNLKRDIITYDEFETLYFATLNIKQLQGYGILNNIKEQEFIDDDQVEELYNDFINFLNKNEAPIKIIETPINSLNNQFIYISKKKIYSYLRKLFIDENKSNDYIKSDNTISYAYYKQYIEFIEDLQERDRRKNAYFNKLEKCLIDLIEVDKLKSYLLKNN